MACTANPEKPLVEWLYPETIALNPNPPTCDPYLIRSTACALSSFWEAC
jgi:hypothetical protein